MNSEIVTIKVLDKNMWSLWTCNYEWGDKVVLILLNLIESTIKGWVDYSTNLSEFNSVDYIWVHVSVSSCSCSSCSCLLNVCSLLFGAFFSFVQHSIAQHSTSPLHSHYVTLHSHCIAKVKSSQVKPNYCIAPKQEWNFQM